MSIDATKPLPQEVTVSPTVKTIPVTEKIIKDIVPLLPKGSRIIAGYLNEEDLYWKINYHWDVLHEAVAHCRGLQIDLKSKTALSEITVKLDDSAPDPNTGYRTSTKVGEPKDKSTHETILARHKVVSACKRDLKTIIEKAEIFSKTKRNKKALELAYAPVASPSKGKHKTGYALDIAGNNELIVGVVNATNGYAFNEGSHVHCEWKNGVDVSAGKGADKAKAASQGVGISINSNLGNIRHGILAIV